LEEKEEEDFKEKKRASERIMILRGEDFGV